MDRWDVLALLGIAGLGMGLGLLAPWLGVSVAGFALLAIGISGAVITERTTTAATPPGADSTGGG